MDNKNNKKIDKIIKDMEKSWRNKDEDIKSDILGSYTGNIIDDEYEVPQQDADDL